ncbi:MAG: hypothetical protein HUJ61_00905 [Bacilli bacterium]|nr:hypothetical protein [Bacilli bacterium]
MKRNLLRDYSFLFCVSLSSCFGIRTHFKFPNEYGESVWVANNSEITITIFVDSLKESLGQIEYNEKIYFYDVIFAVEGANFRCLNNNDEYILENGTSMKKEDYNILFPNVKSNVKSSSFTVISTQMYTMSCFIMTFDLAYILPEYETNNSNDRLYFSFEMQQDYF